MTVIRPNSVSGINSITVASGAALAVHKADGTLIQTIAGATGVSTFSSVSVGSGYTDNSAAKSINIGLGASIAQHNDNTLTFGTNGDPRITIDASGNFNVGSAATIKAGGNATFSGIVTATSFKGDGSGLSGITGTTINNNADNRLITGSGTANTLEGEATLTYNGTDTFELQPASATPAIFVGDSNRTGAGQGLVHYKGNWNGTTVARITMDAGDDTTNKDDGIIRFDTAAAGSVAEAMRIDTAGRVLIGTTATTGGTQKLQVVETTGGRIVLARDDTTVSNGADLGIIQVYGNDNDGNYQEVAAIHFQADLNHGTNDKPGKIVFKTTSDGGSSSTERLTITSSGNVIPGSNNSQDLGSSSLRWANLYTNDLNLSNKGSTNSVDGTWGSYTIQEGENDLFLINKRNGKKYKFNLTEVS